MQDAEQERRLELLRRQEERESRSMSRRSSATRRGVFGFGSGTPREICMPLRLAHSSASLNGAVAANLSTSACGVGGGSGESAHMRSHRRAVSATAACRHRTTGRLGPLLLKDTLFSSGDTVPAELQRSWRCCGLHPGLVVVLSINLINLIDLLYNVNY